MRNRRKEATHNLFTNLTNVFSVFGGQRPSIGNYYYFFLHCRGMGYIGPPLWPPLPSHVMAGLEDRLHVHLRQDGVVGCHKALNQRRSFLRVQPLRESLLHLMHVHCFTKLNIKLGGGQGHGGPLVNNVRHYNPKMVRSQAQCHRMICRDGPN